MLGSRDGGPRFADNAVTFLDKSLIRKLSVHHAGRRPRHRSTSPRSVLPRLAAGHRQGRVRGRHPHEGPKGQQNVRASLHRYSELCRQTVQHVQPAVPPAWKALSATIVTRAPGARARTVRFRCAISIWSLRPKAAPIKSTRAKSKLFCEPPHPLKF